LKIFTNFTATTLFILITLNFRTLKIINSIERKNQVKRRWKVGEMQYNSAVRVLEEERKNRVLENLYTLAVERVFLLTLKRKYAGNETVFYEGRIVKYSTIHRIVHGFSKAVPFAFTITQSSLGDL
jgi:hypothetical protein